MDQKVKDFIAELRANRRDTLDKASITSIQPRGKYLGFDVFTWLDAPESTLHSTFQSMPFPIHWVSTLNYFNVVVNSGHSQFPNVNRIYLLDDSEINTVLNNEIQQYDTVSSILKLPEFTHGKGIIMLTGLGASGIDAINEMALILKTIHGI